MGLKQVVKRLLSVACLPNYVFFRNRVPILYYHGIGPSPYDEVTPELFHKHIKFLTQKYKIKSVSDIKNSTREKNVIGLSFDDGFESVYTHAFPVLKKFNAKATIYLATKYIDNVWMDNETPMLKSHQIKEMADYGIEFASHTHTHCDVSKAPIPNLIEDLKKSQEIISRFTGDNKMGFAYPFGYELKQNDAPNFFKDLNFSYIASTTQDGYLPGAYVVPRIIVCPNDNLFDILCKANGLQIYMKYWLNFKKYLNLPV